MRVLICGARDWQDTAPIAQVIASLPPGSVVIHGAQGGQREDGDWYGADYIAGRLAHRYGLEVHPHPANWHRYGLSAGPFRNQEMLDEEQPEVVYAFHPNINASKGTKDMVRRARRAGITVHIVTGEVSQTRHSDAQPMLDGLTWL